jgi:hypothetical protein
MQDLSTIKLSWFQRRRINHVAKYFRKTDIFEYAKKHEDEFINNKINLLPILIWVPDFLSGLEITRVSINKTIRQDKTNNRLFEIEDLKYPPEKVIL